MEKVFFPPNLILHGIIFKSCLNLESHRREGINYTLTKIYNRFKFENYYFSMQDSKLQLITVLPPVRLHREVLRNIYFERLT